MSKKFSGVQQLSLLLVIVIVGPILWSAIKGGDVWVNYPWGVVAMVAASFLYLTRLNEVLLTLLVYLDWLIAIIFFKEHLIFPKFIILAILAGFMTGLSAMLGIHARHHQ